MLYIADKMFNITGDFTKTIHCLGNFRKDESDVRGEEIKSAY